VFCFFVRARALNFGCVREYPESLMASGIHSKNKNFTARESFFPWGGGSIEVKYSTNVK